MSLLSKLGRLFGAGAKSAAPSPPPPESPPQEPEPADIEIHLAMNSDGSLSTPSQTPEEEARIEEIVREFAEASELHEKSKTAGLVRGKHYTERLPELQELNQAGDSAGLEALLYECVDAAEEESRTLDYGCTPDAYHNWLAAVLDEKGDAAGAKKIRKRFKRYNR